MIYLFKSILERSFNMCKILDKIKGLTAEDLLERYSSDEIPVDLNRILKGIGISAISTDFKDIEAMPQISDEIRKNGSILGMVLVNEDNAGIFYKNDESFVRQRFTIAHELGHCCLGIEKNEYGAHIEYRKSSETYDPKELKCNIFAGELLVPTKMLDKIYSDLPPGILPSLDALAKAFNVSHHVMEQRLKYLKKSYQVVL